MGPDRVGPDVRVLHTSPTGRVERHARGGETIIRKVQRQPRKLRQEIDALRAWGPRLQPWVPRLLAVDERAGWFDLEDRPGAAPSSDGLPPEVAREAGRCLRVLHELSVEDTDPVPLADAIERRLARFRAEAAGYVDPARIGVIVDRVQAALQATAEADRLWRVPCHRDFAPYNWLVTSEGDLTVLDFEHARLDWAPLDRARLDALVLAEHPEARAAFDASYPPPISEAVRWALADWEAARTYVWGRMHDDAEFVARGERMMQAVAGAGSSGADGAIP